MRQLRWIMHNIERKKKDSGPKTRFVSILGPKIDFRRKYLIFFLRFFSLIFGPPLTLGPPTHPRWIPPCTPLGPPFPHGWFLPAAGGGGVAIISKKSLMEYLGCLFESFVHPGTAFSNVFISSILDGCWTSKSVINIWLRQKLNTTRFCNRRNCF